MDVKTNRWLSVYVLKSVPPGFESPALSFPSYMGLDKIHKSFSYLKAHCVMSEKQKRTPVWPLASQGQFYQLWQFYQKIIVQGIVWRMCV